MASRAVSSYAKNCWILSRALSRCWLRFLSVVMVASHSRLEQNTVSMDSLKTRQQQRSHTRYCIRGSLWVWMCINTAASVWAPCKYGVLCYWFQVIFAGYVFTAYTSRASDDVPTLYGETWNQGGFRYCQSLSSELYKKAHCIILFGIGQCRLSLLLNN